MTIQNLYAIDRYIGHVIDRHTTKNVDISVIIVTFNRANLLDELLKSLERQSFDNFDIIIIDNNSKDNTKDIAMNYDLIYIKLKENYGPSLGRNVGLKYACGDIVCFLDDDAIADENLIKSHYEGHTKFDIFCMRGKVLPRSRAIYNCVTLHYDLGDSVVPSPINIEGNSSFKRNILNDVGGFDPDLFIHKHEGNELTYRILKKFGGDVNKSIYYPNAIIYHDYAKSITNFLEKVYINQVRVLEMKKRSQDMLKFINRFPSNRQYRENGVVCYLFTKLYLLYIGICRVYIYLKNTMRLN